MTDPITDEAVEAVARVLCSYYGQDPDTVMPGGIGQRWRINVPAARAILTAAAPIIAAQATADLRARIEALHSPVHVTFSWDRGLQMNPICDQCHGKAGVHPCGCWADDDLIPECGECTERQGKRRVVTWPCPTIRALNALIGGAK